MTEIKVMCELISRGFKPSAKLISDWKRKRLRRTARGLVVDNRPRKLAVATCRCGRSTGARGATCESGACKRENRIAWQREKRARRRAERIAKSGPIKYGPKPKGATP